MRCEGIRGFEADSRHGSDCDQCTADEGNDDCRRVRVSLRLRGLDSFVERPCGRSARFFPFARFRSPRCFAVVLRRGRRDVRKSMESGASTLRTVLSKKAHNGSLSRVLNMKYILLRGGIRNANATLDMVPGSALIVFACALRQYPPSELHTKNVPTKHGSKRYRTAQRSWSTPDCIIFLVLRCSASRLEDVLSMCGPSCLLQICKACHRKPSHYGICGETAPYGIPCRTARTVQNSYRPIPYRECPIPFAPHRDGSLPSAPYRGGPSPFAPYRGVPLPFAPYRESPLPCVSYYVSSIPTVL